MTISVIFLLVFVAFYILNKNTFKKYIAFGAITYLTVISLSNLSVQINNPLYNKTHFTHNYNIKHPEYSRFQLQITEHLKPNNYYQRYTAKLEYINNLKVSGNILLTVNKENQQKTYTVDDKLITYGKLSALHDPLNPYQFNYKSYLENHQIYAELKASPEQLTVIPTNKQSIYGFADNIRRNLNRKLVKYNFSESELAVINALLLGQKQSINKDLYTDYVQAGAIHILAISGLHIGIILLILKWLLKPLILTKNGHYIKAIIILIILWSYAVIAGLSPSILRAVTMFSLITIGMYLKHLSNIYNTLAISAFLLLIINPLLLIEVGFQLSYLAVIGIVAINPLLFKVLKTRYRLLNKFITLITVSLSAQLAILPLSLYYFHQFPGLFLITNVVIIPLLGFILGYGILVFFMASINIPQNILTDGFGDVISLMNQFFKWIAQHELFVIKDIPMNWLLTLTLYILIFSATQFFIKNSYKRLVIALSCIGFFQISVFLNKQWHRQGKEFIIFHKSKHSIISEKHGSKAVIHHTLNSENLDFEYNISNYKVGRFIDKLTYKNLQNIYKHNNQYLLIVDSLAVYKNLPFKPDYVILSQSPKINLNRLLDSLNPKVIVADGSNYKSFVKHWKETCKKRKRPFHYTGEKGAFILK
ncbi:ComEC/Rec2 family competence protein [Bizionia sp. KMM 8389]